MYAINQSREEIGERTDKKYAPPEARLLNRKLGPTKEKRSSVIKISITN